MLFHVTIVTYLKTYKTYPSHIVTVTYKTRVILAGLRMCDGNMLNDEVIVVVGDFLA